MIINGLFLIPVLVLVIVFLLFPEIQWVDNMFKKED